MILSYTNEGTLDVLIDKKRYTYVGVTAYTKEKVDRAFRFNRIGTAIRLLKPFRWQRWSKHERQN